MLIFLESWFPLSALGLKQLTLKTAALVALVLAQRIKPNIVSVKYRIYEFHGHWYPICS